MSELARRSLDQPYHSLTEEVNVAGRPAVEGCVLSSVRSTAVVGPQVLVRKFPLPRKVLWYQGQEPASVVNAEEWKPIQPPPARMYRSNPDRWAAVFGASSRKRTTW
jgi:hypothetical protein